MQKSLVFPVFVKSGIFGRKFFHGRGLKKESLIGRILIKGEHWIYKKADAIIFLKEGDYTYITDNKWDIAQGGDIDLASAII